MIIYIKELEKEHLGFLEKIKSKLKMILIRQIDDKRKIFLLPNINDKKTFKKLNKKIKKYPNSKIVLSKKIKKYESEIKNGSIIRGKIVQKNLIHKIVKFVAGNLKLKDIYIISKKYDLITVKLTNYFVEKVKSVNIVTNEIEKYKNLEAQIYNEKGIIITVSNNKKKSLKKANIIINIDMNNNEINKYSINRNSIIINIANEKIDKIAVFEGIIVNNVQVELEESIKELFIKDNLYGYFENSELYEALVEENVKSDKIRLKELIGNNGIISFNEIQKISKESTK